MRTVIPILLSSTSEVVNPKMSHLKSVPHQKWFWCDKAGHWVPKNIENHHGSSTLSQRLLSKGLISEKAPEEIERSRQWRVHVTAFKKRVDTVANLASEKHRPCKRRSGIGCVFCGTWGKNLYVCSSCVVKLLGSSDESLKMSYLLSVWHGLEDKADALLDFISPGVAQEVEDEIEYTRTGKIMEVNHHEQRNPKNRKLDHRAGSLSTIRMQKKSTVTIKKRSATSLLKNRQDQQAVSGV